MNPLYWKCIWSTIKNPGCKNNEAEITRCMDGCWDPGMNLTQKPISRCTELASQRELTSGVPTKGRVL